MGIRKEISEVKWSWGVWFLETVGVVYELREKGGVKVEEDGK